MALLLMLMLSLAPAISLVATAQPPPPVDVHLTDPSMVLMVQDNESQIISLPGFVQTNYPGLKVDVALETHCDNFTTTVDPMFMSFRGQAKMDFSILVEVFIGNESERGCLGTLRTNIMITYPGGNAMEQTSQSFSITVLKEDQATNDTVQDPGPQRRSSPDDTALALNGLGLLAIAAVGATALVLRRRLVPLKGRRGP
jgi:hypothetical protein